MRPGVPNDLKALIALDDVAGSDTSRRRLIDEGLRDAEISVAVVSGAPKGYALLNHRFYGHAFIELVIVSADSRRSGIGAALVEDARKRARGSKLFTSTNESNAPMRALLCKLDFRESGIIHNLDADDPELVYFKPLAR